MEEMFYELMRPGMIWLLALAMTAPAAASGGGDDASVPSFGVRGGVGFDFPNDFDPGSAEDGFSPGLSFSLGGVYRCPLYQFLFLHTGVTANYDSYGIKETDRHQYAVRKIGVAVPVNIGLTLGYDKINILMNTGPALSVGLWEKYGKSQNHVQPLSARGLTCIERQKHPVSTFYGMPT